LKKSSISNKLSISAAISYALQDLVTARPAILMHLTAMAEQFNKLKQADAEAILSEFEKDDLKGFYDVRTYITHQYEGVNLSIIEWIIRYGLPKFKTQCQDVICKYNVQKPT